MDVNLRTQHTVVKMQKLQLTKHSLVTHDRHLSHWRQSVPVAKTWKQDVLQVVLSQWHNNPKLMETFLKCFRRVR